jgi:predicted amidohydrolase YtcJ
MTTLNGAQFLNREATMGTVEPGKNADLVLLDANPIGDAANLSKIAAVFLNGKYFSKAALDKLKSDVAAAYNAQAVQPLSAVLDPNHVH